MPRVRAIAEHIPLLRRYARALHGSQKVGDRQVQACLEWILADTSRLPAGLPPRVGLYKAFHSVEMPDRSPPSFASMDPALERKLQDMRLPSRQALLLTAMEGFSIVEAAEILSREEAGVRQLLQQATEGISQQPSTRVLIIEDESIISLDLTNIMVEMGHQVVHVGRTKNEAVEAARRLSPGLVLADIKLADGSSGVDAVRQILDDIAVPVVFITAYPERLLTGEVPEPTFLVTKPFAPEAVRAAVSQALFFA